MMESDQEKKWSASNAQTLLWCCFCDERFEKPEVLSTHLDKYNVNWKLYWQLHYSSRDGKACVLCNVLHADRNSLECHFKMVHCITGPCAKREPEVVTMESEPLDASVQTESLQKTTAVDAEDELRIPLSEGEQEDPQKPKEDDIDDIDILFEINHDDAEESQTPNVATPDSFHLVIPCTSSEAEQSPASDHVQTNQNEREKSEVLQAPERNLTRSTTPLIEFSVLHSDDEVEELGEDEADLLSLSKSNEEVEEVAAPSARTEPEIYTYKTEVIDLEDVDAPMVSFEGSERLEVPPSMVEHPHAVNLPTENKQARPTAVVNPFGAHGERCTTSNDGRDPDIAESSSSDVPPPLQLAEQELRSRPAPSTLPTPDSDLIAVIPDAVDSDSDDDVPAPPVFDPLQVDSSPPQSPSDVEIELVEKTSSGVNSSVKVEMPDLSRLTPSKIAAYMNKGVFSAKHQSDIEKHLEKKTDAANHGETRYGTSSAKWEVDSEGSCESGGDAASVGQSDSIGSEEDEESLPFGFGFNIVNVESLLPEPVDIDKDMDEHQGGISSTKGHHMRSRSSRHGGDEPSVNTGTRKRTLSKVRDRDPQIPHLPSVRDADGHHPIGGKRSRSDAGSHGGQQPTSTIVNEVFKQPIELCVGLINAGSLVEVSTANVQKSSKTRDSLDGMVMKVETTGNAVRYYIHFPNMDKRLDRWVSAKEIIQVYRTEIGSVPQGERPPMASSSLADQAKRRLAFEPSPERPRSKKATEAQATEPATSAPKPPQQPGRPGRPKKGTAPKRTTKKTKNQQSRVIRIAKARLILTRQKSKAMAERQTSRAPQSLQRGDDVTGTDSSMQMDTDQVTRTSLRPRRAHSAASTSDSSQGGDEASEGSDRLNDGSHSREASSEKRKAESADLTRSIRKSFSALAKWKGRKASRKGPKEAEQKLGADSTTAECAANAGQNGATADDGSKIWEKRSEGMRKRPPPGIDIIPFWDGMVEVLRPGVMLYVICTVLKGGWFRLYPAVIKAVVNGNQFHVHYFGYKSCHDELIAAELIHSVLKLREGKRPNQFKTSWVVKSNERASHESGNAASAGTDSKPGGSSRSSVQHPKMKKGQHKKNQPKLTLTSDKGERKVVRTSRIILKPRFRDDSRPERQRKLSTNQHSSKPSDEVTAPILTPECPSTLSRDVPADTPDVPPSLEQDANGRGNRATRGSTARGGVGRVEFWTSLANMQDNAALRKTKSAKSTTESLGNDAVEPGQSDQASAPDMAPVVGTADAGFKSPEGGAKEGPHSNPLARGPAKAKRGRPPKAKFATAKPKSSDQPRKGNNVIQPVSSATKSDGIDASSTAGLNRERCVEGTTAARPGVQRTHTDTPPHTKRRRGRPAGKRDTSDASSLAQPSARPPSGTDLQPVQRSVDSETGQPETQSSSCEIPPTTSKQSTTTGCPADDASVPACSTDSSSVSVAKLPVATGLKIKKRGRPPGKRQIASIPQTTDETSSAVPGVPSSSSDVPVPAERPAGKARDDTKGQDTATTLDGAPERPTTADPVSEKRPRRRVVRSVETAGTPEAVVPPAPPRPPSSASTGAVASGVMSPLESDKIETTSNVSKSETASNVSAETSIAPVIPCTAKKLKKIRDGDLVYVVYEVKADGTKITYPAKILAVNRDLYYARFHIHYFGWAHRYDEWVAEDVIHGVVDCSHPNFKLKSLKRRSVSPKRQEQLDRVRPCSVDLSINNICFFSALSKGRVRVDDKRIQALQAEAKSRELAPTEC